jgi:ABC-type ATPase involved in cell division
MEINKIILVDFKIFKGEHVFDLRNLNIFTGPNNAGKSTLIKAISLFAKGLEKGDFPSLDLFEANAGEFKDLVNWESGAKSFKIGFYIEIGEKKVPFKVLYEFVDGDNVRINREIGKAIFSNFEIFDNNGSFFFGAYLDDTFETKKEDLDYDIESDITEIEPGTLPFKCALEDSNRPILFLKFDINNLENKLHLFTKKRYKKLLDHVKKLHKHNNWWIGRLDEENFDSLGVEEITLVDIREDFYKNEFLELLDYDSSNEIFWGNDETLQQEILSKYAKTLENTNYDSFIKEVIKPLFKSLENALNLFKKNNFIHIQFQDLTQQLFTISAKNKYLLELFQSREYQKIYTFSRNALKIFGIDAYIEIKSHLNRAIEINLVEGLHEIDEKFEQEYKDNSRDKDEKEVNEIKAKESKSENKDETYENKLITNNDKKKRVINVDDNPFSFLLFASNYEKRYANAKRINIANFGKGIANIVGLILKIQFVLKDLEREKRRSEIYKSEKSKSKLILVEEPEAFLHPNWQSKLADFFVFCLKETQNYNVKIVIETHSVYLIQRLQYLVAKKKISNKNIFVYYFDNKSEKEKFYEMGLREDGMFKNKFGKGFYDETANLTLDILNLSEKDIE